MNAFTPSAQTFVSYRQTATARSLGIDPSQFTDVMQQFASSSSLLLSDAMDAVTAVAPGVATDAAAAAADNGWFGFLTLPIEALLQFIHSLIAATGTTNAWGVTIIVLTVLIKVVTFPLTKTQLESTNKMQAMAPAIKEIQAKYQSNPEVMNQKVAEFYQTNEINPLAGCLPSLAQIPIFIGLYRAVLDLAAANKLNEAFFFLPNLEGPTYGAAPANGADWILQGWYVLLFLATYKKHAQLNLYSTTSLFKSFILIISGSMEFLLSDGMIPSLSSSFPSSWSFLNFYQWNLCSRNPTTQRNNNPM